MNPRFIKAQNQELLRKKRLKKAEKELHMQIKKRKLKQ